MKTISKKPAKVLSLFLSLLMIFSMFVAIPAFAIPEPIEIKENEPYILADVGDDVQFSDYSVSINNTNYLPTAVEWYYEGNAVTSKTTTSAGALVYEVRLKSNATIKKNVYLLAKNPLDTEYVIYTNNFETTNEITEANAFAKSHSAAYYSVADGKYVINARNGTAGEINALLPAWIGDFGNYKIEASVMLSNVSNDTRWCSVMYRVKDIPFPYYQMAVRKTASANGVELAYRNLQNQWEVRNVGSYSSNLSETFYNFKIEVKDNVVKESINDTMVIYAKSSVGEITKGNVGFQVNNGVMSIDSIKISVQTATPVQEIPTYMEDLQYPDSKIENSFAVYARVASAADLTAAISAKAQGAVISVADNLNVTGFTSKTLEAFISDLNGKMIPVINLSSAANATAVANYFKTKNSVDVLLIADNAEYIKAAKTANPKLSVILGLNTLNTDAAKIRELVNSCKANGVSLKEYDKELVRELQSYSLHVSVQNINSGNVDLMKSVLSGANAVITAYPVQINNVITNVIEKDTLTRTPVIIGHRGNPSKAPENSMSAYKLAIANGSDIVETDIYLSKDNKIVIMHDTTIDRTTTGAGNVSSLTLAELKKYYLWGDNDQYKTTYPNERIPTLDELFALIKGTKTKVFVEIKTGDPRIVPILRDLINSMGVADNVSVISFSREQIIDTQKFIPYMSTGYLLGAMSAMSATNTLTTEIKKQIEFVNGANSTFNPASANLNNQVANAFNARGITIWPWTYTIASSGSFDDGFINGYGGLTTNDPQYTKDTVKYIEIDFPKNDYKHINELYIDKTVDTNLKVFAYTYGGKKIDITNDVTFEYVDNSSNSISITGSKINVLNKGNAYIVAKYKTKLPSDYPYTLYSSVVNVNTKYYSTTNSITLKSTSKYKLSVNASNSVYNVSEKTTVSDFKNNFENSSSLSIVDKNRENSTTVIATGAYVVYNTNEDVRLIVVKGDLNGDGKISSIDYVLLKKYILNNDTLSGAYVLAADYNVNDTVTAIDYVQLKKYLV